MHSIKHLLPCAALLTFALTAPAASAAQGNTQTASEAPAKEPKPVPVAQAAPAPAQATTAPAPATTSAKTSPAPDAKVQTAAVSDDTVRLGPVVVVATRIAESPYEVAGTTDVVSAANILAAGSTTLGDAFKYIPGVSVPFSGGASTGAVPYTTGGEKGINIRGLEDNRISIAIDGIRQPDDFTAGTGSGFASPGRIFFDPATYAQFEIFKTAASSLYGSGALGGAIGTFSIGPEHLLGSTLKGYALSNSAGFASANNSINNLAQGAVGNGTWAASAVYSVRKGNEAETAGPDRLNSEDFKSQAVISKLVRKFDGAKIEATVDYYHLDQNVLAQNAAGVMSMGPTMRYEYLAPTQDTTRERLRLSLGAELTPAAGSNVLYDRANILGYWQKSQNHSINYSTTNIVRGTTITARDRINTQDHDTEVTGINAAARKDIPGSIVSQTIQYGVETSFSAITSGFARVENGVRADDPIAMAPTDIYRIGVFVSDKISFGERKQFVLTPSLRTDYYNVNPDNTDYYMEFAGTKSASFVNWSVSPGLSGLFKVTKELNFYALYAMGNRNPSADELSGSFTHSGGGMAGGQLRTYPNPDLKNETSNNFEIGFQGNLEHHSFRLSGYYNLYSDFIDTMHNSGQLDADGYLIYRSRNLDNVNIYGLELSYDWRVQKWLTGGIEGFQAGLAVAWTKGEQDTDTGRQPLDSVDPWKVVAYVGYTDPNDKWGVRLSATYVAKKSRGDISTETLATTPPVDNYFILDVTGFYRFDEHWSINAGINNLTNKEYTTWSMTRSSSGGMGGGGYTMPGINGFISLTAKF
jgi:hemoglobin/transferrin/lactoferrin receptor protein